ncbi:hypothetical protein SNE40_001545 [Patella caerulea]|uniref:Uncharacterized protein n=1 Tax=Patella caerulea TaxID=87958 RepID=A0AAN8KES5_PATCE
MKIHQLVTASFGELFFRELSCYCNAGRNGVLCSCYKSECTHFKFKADPLRQSDCPEIKMIEDRLTEETLIRFQKRLDEGYDVSPKLGALSSEEKTEYALWVTWKSLKSRYGQGSVPTVIDQSAYSDDDEPEDDNDNDDVDWIPLNNKTKNCNIDPTKYYAVWFSLNSKPTCYIGRPLKKSYKDHFLFKFLELKSYVGYVYDLPRRDDIAEIESKYIIQNLKRVAHHPLA